MHAVWKRLQIDLQNDRVSDPCGLPHQNHTWETQTSPDNPSHTNTDEVVIQQTFQSESSSNKKKYGKLPGEGAEAGSEGRQPA